MFIATREERGDTLVEVLLATAIMAFIVAGTSFIMNSGLAKTQLSLEHTETQARVAGQAAVLRALHAAALKSGEVDTEAKEIWNEVVAYAASPSQATEEVVCDAGKVSNRRFYFNTAGDSPASWLRPIGLPTGSEVIPQNGTFVPVAGDGIWVEAYRRGASPGYYYYDFYVKACWEAAGDQPRQSVRTVVRLYEVL